VKTLPLRGCSKSKVSLGNAIFREVEMSVFQRKRLFKKLRVTIQSNFLDTLNYKMKDLQREPPISREIQEDVKKLI